MTVETPHTAPEERPEEHRISQEGGPPRRETAEPGNPESPTDAAEQPGSGASSHDHEDALVDEWGEESFPGSDPPGHY